MAIAAGALYHPPYVVLSPGDAFDVGGDIAISGVAVQAPTRRYLATTVRLSQPSAIGLLVAALRDDREVLSARQVVPPASHPAPSTASNASCSSTASRQRPRPPPAPATRPRSPAPAPRSSALCAPHQPPRR
jgi:PDZ domain-containing secreted protein